MPAIAKSPANLGKKTARSKASRTASGQNNSGQTKSGRPVTYGGFQERFYGLSPGFAFKLSFGLVMALSLVLLLTSGRMEKISQFGLQVLANKLGDFGFRVEHIVVTGASPYSEPDIRKSLGIREGVPIFSQDLDTGLQRLNTLGWLKSARILRLLPQTLVVAVEEKPRLAIWQNQHILAVIDAQGDIIGEADPLKFQNLPLVVGAGANQAAAGLLPLIEARPALMRRLWALARIDNRRWDIILKDNSLIQLPAQGEEEALMRLDRLNRDQNILSLGFSRIDLKTKDIFIRAKADLASPPIVSETAHSKDVSTKNLHLAASY